MNHLTHYLNKKLSCKQLTIILAATLASLACQVQAADAAGAKLVQERRCYPCHDMTNTLIGPPYQAIALRHAANKDFMVDVLAEKIIVGGAGNWGVVPMVPNEQVSRDEARVIAKWILEQTNK